MKAEEVDNQIIAPTAEEDEKMRNVTTCTPMKKFTVSSCTSGTAEFLHTPL